MMQSALLNERTNTTLTLAISRLKEAIRQRRPILGEIMDQYHNTTIYDYSLGFLDIHETPLLEGRRSELIEIVRSLLDSRLGSKIADEVSDQLTALPLVSTADHHGPIDHPFFVNSNIISSLHFPECKHNYYAYLIDFSFSSISLNNSSHPRGIAFHAQEHGIGDLIRLSLFPDKEKMGVVYKARPYTKRDLDRIIQEIDHKLQTNMISKDRANQVKEILVECFAQPAILESPDFISQVTRINYELWPKLFHAPDMHSSTYEIPNLIYLEIETIVSKILLCHHLDNPNSLIYKFLFDDQIRPLVMKHFNNLPGSFSLEEHWGSYLFWGFDHKQRRARLELEGSYLINHDHGIRIELSPKGIRSALEQKQIFPTMLLSYIMVPLYYGIKCLGGFSQVNDLTITKKSWQQFLTEIGDINEVKALEPVQTKVLGGDGMVLVYLKDTDQNLIPATGTDLILEATDTSYSYYIDLSKKLTLSEIASPLLPEIYKVVYPTTEREEELANISVEEIVMNSPLFEVLG